MRDTSRALEEAGLFSTDDRDYQNLSMFLGTAVATIVTKKRSSLQESSHDIPV